MLNTHNANLAAESQKGIEIKVPINSNIFKTYSYISGASTYYAYFGKIASHKSITGIDLKKAIDWVENTLSDKILDKHYKENFRVRKGTREIENILYVLEGEMIIDIEDEYAGILFNSGQEQLAEIWACHLKDLKKRSQPRSAISMIVSNRLGLNLEEIKLKKRRLNINDNYNDDLALLHPKILKALKQKSKGGLHLFHGRPGTGKSTYLQFLINSLDKRVIFLSPQLAANLETPQFITLLLENRNSILVIEDAEDLLVSREGTNNPSISFLLNLCDGLLGEGLGIQVICTFNTAVQRIDKAMLRKGRLLSLYEFRELSVWKSNALLNKRGVNSVTETPLTLAEIYGFEEHGFSISTKQLNTIGFRSTTSG